MVLVGALQWCSFVGPRGFVTPRWTVGRGACVSHLSFPAFHPSYRPAPSPNGRTGLG